MRPLEGNVGRVITEAEHSATLRVPRPIDLVQLQTTVSTCFTARDDADFHIHAFAASNVTALADSITVYLVPSGGTAGPTNLIVYQRVVPANGTVWVFSEEYRALLQPGATLEALCGTNDAINVFGFGYDYQGAYG